MNSKELFEESKKYIPGGVNSPVRAFRSVGGTPFFVSHAAGSKIRSVEGCEYIDFVCSWGPAIFGHNHPTIREALERALVDGTSFGTPSFAELEMARMINSMVPCAQMVRMTNSGTEAAMSAVRLARGFTGRDRIVKFSGCYHGHVDSLLVKAGSGAVTFGNSDSAGVPAALAELTTVLPFNDFEALESCFAAIGGEIAAVILEPFPANVGLILPQKGFLEALRKYCDKSGSLLIFDEVITGFRLSEGGAQEYTGVMPDLCVLGKIIGGGLPVGAFAGRSDIMSKLAPLGPVYQAGTLSGNPLAMAAGLAALTMIREIKPYEMLRAKAEFVVAKLNEASHEKGIAVHIPQVESLFSVFFNAKPVLNYADALESSTSLYAKYFHACLKGGVYIAPSAFETSFISLAHSEDDLHKAVEVMSAAIKSL